MQTRQNYYGHWARSKKLVSKIENTLQAGGIVMISTYTHAKQYNKRHINMFKAEPSGAYVKRGKHWDCIDYCGFRFLTPKENTQ